MLDKQQLKVALLVLSGSAHTQREAIKSALAADISSANSGITSLSSSAAVANANLKSTLDSSISSLSGSAHTANANLASAIASDIASLSGSAHTQRAALDASIASEQSAQDGRLSSLESFTASLDATYATDAEVTSAVSTLSGSAHVQRAALDSAQSTALSNHSGSSAAALRAEYVAGDSALSGSAHTQREAIKTALASDISTNAGDISTNASSITSLSGSAASARAGLASDINTEKGRIDAILTSATADADSFAEIVTLINSVDTANDQAFAAHYTASNNRLAALETESGSVSGRVTALESFSSSLDNTFATDAELSSVSSSFATTIGGLTTDYTELDNIPAGIISSSAQQVAGLVNQDVNLGTGALTASIFSGDGSGLTNLDISQTATVVNSFTSVTTFTVNHNFGTKNILVTVYDDNDYQIFPASIQVFENTADITFDSATTGTVIVGKGGHVVSGSILYDNVIGKPALVSGSAQVESLFGSTGVSQSIDSRLDSVESSITNLDNTYATDAELSAVSASLASEIGAISTDFADIQNKPTLVSGSSQIDITSTTGYSTVAGNISTNASNITALSSSAEVKREAIKNALASDISSNTSAISSLSGSAHVQREAIKTSLEGEINTEKGRIDAILSASTADTDTFAEIVNLVNQVDTENDQAFAAFYTSSNAADAVQDGRLDSIELFTSSIDSTYASEVQLTALSSSAEVKREAIKTQLSSNISSNASSISTNVTNISTNASDISTNASNITALSGSAQVKREAIKNALANDISTNASNISTNTGNISTNASDISTNAGNITALSSSAHTANANLASSIASEQSVQDGRLDSLESFTASLDDTFATEAEMNATSASVKSYADGIVSTLSGSAHTANANLKSTLDSSISSLSGSAHTANVNLKSTVDSSISSLSGSAHSQRAALASGLSSDISSLSGSAHTQRDALATGLSSDISSLSGSAHGQRVAIETSLDSKIDTEKGRIDAILTGSQADKDTFAEIVTLINQVDTENDTAFAGYVTSSNARQTTIENSVTSLSGSAHSQRVAIQTALNSSISSNTSGINSLSGSAHTQRAALVSGLSSDLSSLSGSAHTSRAAIASNVATNASDISSNASDISSNTSAISSLSGSAHAQRVALDNSIASEQSVQDGRLSSLESFTASLDSTFATDAEVTSAVSTLSGSAHSQRVAVASGLSSDISSLSGSAHTARAAIISTVTANDSDISTNAGNISTNASNISSNTSAISSLSSSAEVKREAIKNALTNDISSLSGSAHSQRLAIESSLNSTINNLSSTLAISGSSGNDSVNLKADALSVVGTAGEVETTVTNNQIQIGIVDNATLTGDVTITGNLNVTGDTVQAQVANLNVEDRFILLNSGSAAGDAGIIFGGSDGSVNQGSGIFWDSPANVFGFSQAIGAEDTTATHTSKLGEHSNISS